MRIARDLSFLGRLLGSSSPKASKISNISRFFGLTRGGMSMIIGVFLVVSIMGTFLGLMAGLMTDLSLIGGLGWTGGLSLSLMGRGGGLIGGLIGMGLSLIGSGGLSLIGGLGGLSLMGRDLGLGSLIGMGSPAGKGPGPPFSPEEDAAP